MSLTATVVFRSGGEKVVTVLHPERLVTWMEAMFVRPEVSKIVLYDSDTKTTQEIKRTEEVDSRLAQNLSDLLKFLTANPHPKQEQIAETLNALSDCLAELHTRLAFKGQSIT